MQRPLLPLKISSTQNVLMQRMEKSKWKRKEPTKSSQEFKIEESSKRKSGVVPMQNNPLLQGVQRKQFRALNLAEFLLWSTQTYTIVSNFYRVFTSKIGRRNHKNRKSKRRNFNPRAQTVGPKWDAGRRRGRRKKQNQGFTWASHFLWLSPNSR